MVETSSAMGSIGSPQAGSPKRRSSLRWTRRASRRSRAMSGWAAGAARSPTDGDFERWREAAMRGRVLKRGLGGLFQLERWTGLAHDGAAVVLDRQPRAEGGQLVQLRRAQRADL